MVDETRFSTDMTDISRITGIRAETKFMQEGAFNVALLEVLVGQRTGTLEEQQAIRKLKRKLGDKIYVECVCLLTHKLIPTEKEAKQVFPERAREPLVPVRRPRQVSKMVRSDTCSWSR
jgi:hypothetical protein